VRGMCGRVVEQGKKRNSRPRFHRVRADSARITPGTSPLPGLVNPLLFYHKLLMIYP
jgi:hypothetical protein